MTISGTAISLRMRARTDFFTMACHSSIAGDGDVDWHHTLAALAAL